MLGCRAGIIGADRYWIRTRGYCSCHGWGGMAFLRHEKHVRMWKDIKVIQRSYKVI